MRRDALVSKRLAFLSFSPEEKMRHCVFCGEEFIPPVCGHINCGGKLLDVKIPATYTLNGIPRAEVERMDPAYALDLEPYEVSIEQIVVSFALLAFVGICFAAQYVWEQRKDVAKIFGKSLLVAVFLFDIWAGLMLQATGGAR